MLSFEGVTKDGARKIVIQEKNLRELTKYTIRNQNLFKITWTIGKQTAHAVIDAEIAKLLVQRGAKIGEHVQDYPEPTHENMCVYRMLESVRIDKDIEKIPFNALSYVANNKFFLKEVEYVRAFINRNSELSYEVMGTRMMDGKEFEVSSVIPEETFNVLKSIGCPVQRETDRSDLFRFQGVSNATGKRETMFVHPTQFIAIERVQVHKYDPVYRVSWTNEDKKEAYQWRESAVIEKDVAMEIATTFQVALHKTETYPFNTNGDRCIMQSLPIVPIEQAKNRWDVVQQGDGKNIFYGDIKRISLYRAYNGILETGICLERQFKGRYGGANYGLDKETFERFKEAGVECETRLDFDLEKIDSVEKIEKMHTISA